MKERITRREAIGLAVFATIAAGAVWLNLDEKQPEKPNTSAEEAKAIDLQELIQNPAPLLNRKIVTEGYATFRGGEMRYGGFSYQLYLSADAELSDPSLVFTIDRPDERINALQQAEDGIKEHVSVEGVIEAISIEGSKQDYVRETFGGLPQGRKFVYFLNPIKVKQLNP